MREAQLQAAGVKLLLLLGFDVSNLSQGYRPGGRRHGSSRQTPGVPDSYARHPRYGRVWIEWKGPRTPVTVHQRAWHERERECGREVWVIRDLQELQSQLAELGAPIA